MKDLCLLVAALVFFGCKTSSNSALRDLEDRHDSGTDAITEEGKDLLTDLSGEGKVEDVDTGEGWVSEADEAQQSGVDGGCQEGERKCSEDAKVLFVCQAGAWDETVCAPSRLCFEGACVEPWRYGNPVFEPCKDDPLATEESLGEKARYYDAIAKRLHLHPQLKWAMGATVKKKEVQCGDGICYEPIKSEDELAYEDVERWWTGENDGLWSAHYLASQAFRYAVTKSEEALENIEVLLEGEETRMRITGVPGLFTRQFIPPGVAGIGCPQNLDAYVPDVEKDDNKWVKIGDDGCVYVVSPETMEFVRTEHCGLQEFSGYCFLDNVSQDEYAGHMLALGVVYKLVDVPAIQERVRRLLEQVGDHLVMNDLAFVDWDGRVTEHGKLWVTSLADTPGFLAAESLAFVRMAIEATGRKDFHDFYHDCLLQENGIKPCLHWETEASNPRSYLDYLDMMLAYVGPNGGCKSNFNNFSMVMTFLYLLIWFENEVVEVKEKAQEVMDEQLMRFSSPRALITHKNAWFNFMWAASKKLGPQSDGPAFDAVHDALCSLAEFPASKHRRQADTEAKYPHFCEGRLGDSQTEFPVPVGERCLSTFMWWHSPYDRERCEEVRWDIYMPADYLLAYWMGRFYGFISEGM